MTRRLVVSYLAITVVVLVLLEIPLAVFYGQREQERFIADAERDAVALASYYQDVANTDFVPDTKQAEDYAARINARIILVDRAGISVLDTTAAPGRDFSTRFEVETALGGVRAAGIRRSNTLNTDILYVGVPVASGGIVHGVLRLTLDAHEVTERIQRFWVGLGAVAVVVLVAVAGIGFAIARSVTRPLRELQQSASRFADGDLTPTTIGDDAPHEVEELADAMNAMASRLDQLIEAQRSFVGDASHQLRTPLTALRLRLENLETRLADDDTAEVAAAIDEIQRLSELVNGLLQLARAQQTPAAVTIDAVTVVSDRVDTWSAIADQDHIELDFISPGPPVHVSAIPGAIEQIIDNCLDNALNASAQNTTIAVSISSSADVMTIRVSDEGPGLDDVGKTRALERFWRGDTTKPGTGLGLAIARTLADASAGALVLEDNAAGGLTVAISLPRAAELNARLTARVRADGHTRI